MPRGGFRSMLGRPKGVKETKPRKPRTPRNSLPAPDIDREAAVVANPADIAAINNGSTPLEYMLAIMRDPGADQTRRDRMAMAAAPYCHPRMFDQRVGKKEVQKAKAKTANTAWMADLAMRHNRGEDMRADA